MSGQTFKKPFQGTLSLFEMAFLFFLNETKLLIAYERFDG